MTSDDEGARRFLKEKGITFRSLKGSWEMAGQSYGVRGTPANFLLDQQGRVLFKHMGFGGEKSAEQLAYEIDLMLSRPAAGQR